jgi:phospholipid transport system substrate-binding protein
MNAKIRQRIYGAALSLLGVFPLATVSAAGTEDPAAQHPVQILDESLLKSMRAGAGQSATERYQMLEPVVEAVFDLPLMTRLSVGPAWTKFSAEQQLAVIAAFKRLTIAGYAHNFQTFDGEQFTIDDNIETRGVDKIVQAKITSKHETPASLIYRVRESGGAWKIVDVYYDGISQLTMRRSDFGAAIAGGGAVGLIAHLNSLSDSLMKH